MLVLVGLRFDGAEGMGEERQGGGLVEWCVVFGVYCVRSAL